MAIADVQIAYCNWEMNPLWPKFIKTQTEVGNEDFGFWEAQEGQWVNVERGLLQFPRSAVMCWILHARVEAHSFNPADSILGVTPSWPYHTASNSDGDALCSGSRAEKVWASSSGMVAAVGTLLQTLHLYSWMRLSIPDCVLSTYPKGFSLWRRAFSR